MTLCTHGEDVAAYWSQFEAVRPILHSALQAWDSPVSQRVIRNSEIRFALAVRVYAEKLRGPV